jgi:hypothetical protein
MKSDKGFTENQRFNHPVFMAGLALLSMYSLSKWMNVFYDSSLSPDEIQSRWIGFSIVVLVDLLFIITKLTTKINDQGVSIQFFPFHLKPIIYKWEEIEQLQIKEYNPIGEFGGWGIRFGWGKTKAFTTRGRVGLFITLKQGKKLMIGTQKRNELHKALEGQSQFLEKV